MGGLGAGPEATSPVPGDCAGVRLFWVVLARASESEDLEDFCGVRWEVERSRVGVTADGGAGAGR